MNPAQQGILAGREEARTADVHEALLGIIKQQDEQLRQYSKELAEVVSEHLALRHIAKLVRNQLTNPTGYDETELIEALNRVLDTTESR